ncbi:uncharacterized protein LY89DRAFT_622223 [Mollisia scopiformis]|uniref:Phenol 2-monooxygenase n=1 Tax=Mollisia scopiformis TaxID=149040 RepID=A0A194WZI7_MOLSC|nr:uncharacterized protein LY89DRAFT_622223 [Mollisia scopiformis]KUJ13363.1 hypothetical protein LY89DRAFT_622223 [Mollisia scopiformis]
MQESKVDVLIIGAGPAGYMAASWFARIGINARIIDKRSTKIFVGQADGLQPRVLEVFQSFGFGDRPLKDASIGYEACFYEPDANGKIHRVGRKPEGVVGISRFHGSVIHQGRIETWLTDFIDEWSNGKMKVERPILPETLEIDESQISNPDAYPVTVGVKKLADNDAEPEQYGSKIENGLFRQFDWDQDRNGAVPAESREIIHAKYVLGCDGAHSWVRSQIGINVEGETTDYVWGVLDIVPITDFPDIRKRCSIHSASDGSIMVIPREAGLVRLYIQLKKTEHIPETRSAEERENDQKQGKTAGPRVDRSKITPEAILETARKIFAPYTLDVAETQWFTAYQIGQRVAAKFQKLERVFIAGDACHTHSPKAGQGMNVSMMDTYNLAWKIGHVLNGLAKPDILSTYEQERRKVAQDLIEYDFKLSRLFSGKPGEISTDAFREVIDNGAAFATGCSVNYDGSIIINKPEGTDSTIPYNSPLAKNVPIGMRFADAKVVSQCDGRPWYLNDRIPSDGRWRIILFPSDFKTNVSLNNQLLDIGAYLESSDSFIKRYTPPTEKIDSIIEVLLVHASSIDVVEWDDFPHAFRPRYQDRRMDYWKIYADSESLREISGQAYEKYGIDRKVGALLVLRPDGYVASVTAPNTEGVSQVAAFFDRFLIPL